MCTFALLFTQAFRSAFYFLIFMTDTSYGISLSESDRVIRVEKSVDWRKIRASTDYENSNEGTFGRLRFISLEQVGAMTMMST
jgi:hypothetical protein